LSARISMRILVVVYGWSRQEISLQENTATLMVNATGGLTTLEARVNIGARQERRGTRPGRLPDLAGRSDRGEAWVKKARFRVIWVNGIGPQSGQAGIHLLDTGKTLERSSLRTRSMHRPVQRVRQWKGLPQVGPLDLFAHDSSYQHMTASRVSLGLNAFRRPPLPVSVSAQVIQL
jgi:hypothetical protein